MNGTPDWQRVAAILEAAIDVPEDNRAAFVREACAGDVNLLAEIVALLAAHARSGGFLEGSAIGFGSRTRTVAMPDVSAASAAAAQRSSQVRSSVVIASIGCSAAVAWARCTPPTRSSMVAAWR